MPRPGQSARRGGINESYSNKIVLNIGGQRYHTQRTTLKNVPETRLSNLDESSVHYDSQKDEYFFDRSPLLFSSILDYFRTGHLHFPHCHCGPSIKDELDYWGLDENLISSCCWRSYKEFEDEKQVLQKVQKSMRSDEFKDDTEEDSNQGWFQRWRKIIWNFLDVPQSSKAAQIWAIAIFLLIMISIAVTAMETHPLFRVQKDTPIQLTEKTHQNIGSTNNIETSSVKCNVEIANVATNRWTEHFNSRERRRTSENTTQNTKTNFTLFNCMDTSTSLNPKLQLYYSTDLHMTLQVIDGLCICIFLLELTMRFLASPSKLRFIKAPLNIIDFVSVVPHSAVAIVLLINPDFWMLESDFIVIITYLSLSSTLRVVRVFKIVRHYRGLQLLFLAFRSSIRELILLLLLIMMGTVIFSTLIYFAEFQEPEQFPSIFTGFWWSIITMTTVGFGDATPITTWGYVIGGVCAVSGVLITGLQIPIIASNFNYYYKFERFANSLQRKKAAKKNLWVNNSFPVSINPVDSSVSPEIVKITVSQPDEDHNNNDSITFQTRSTSIDSDQSNYCLGSNRGLSSGHHNFCEIQRSMELRESETTPSTNKNGVKSQRRPPRSQISVPVQASGNCAPFSRHLSPSNLSMNGHTSSFCSSTESLINSHSRSPLLNHQGRVGRGRKPNLLTSSKARRRVSPVAPRRENEDASVLTNV